MATTSTPTVVAYKHNYSLQVVRLYWSDGNTSKYARICGRFVKLYGRGVELVELFEGKLRHRSIFRFVQQATGCIVNELTRRNTVVA